MHGEPFDPAWYAATYPDVERVGMDPWTHFERYGRHLGRMGYPDERRLRRMVLVVPDLSTIGGISSRTRTVLNWARGTDLEVVALTAKSERGTKEEGEICLASDPWAKEVIQTWLPNDTAVVVSNNALRAFKPDIRASLQRLPLVFIYAGQMAFMIQDSSVLTDRKYAKELRAMRLMSFSDADINFQRQLGIHGQVKGFAPVRQRERNTYDLEKNTRLGYVGRIDFHAKDAGKLIDVARSLVDSRWGPIKLFTTDGKNSPQYATFMRMIEEEGLDDQFEVVLNCTDKEQIFSELAFLLVPSRKESFGNSVVEAMSFGVPVIAASYAPGPAEIVGTSGAGYLVDNYSGEEVARVLTEVDAEIRNRMSDAAFRRHQDFTIEAHGQQLKRLCVEAVDEFRGANLLPVFPSLRILGEK